MTTFAGAVVKSVEQDSPAYDAGFGPGCVVTHVDGMPVRDLIDWRWLASDDEMEVAYVDADGDAGSIVLEREPGEGWGFVFDGAVFDGIRTCRNSCKFCFMRQLPKGLRSSLSTRDDDFRLSFLTGTFATLTNLSEDDVARIVEQRLSPLRVSLHAVDPKVRRSLMGRNADAGIENLERLLAEGVEFDAQVVLLPGENDGAVLDETLEWAYARPGIQTVGIVPLGFTRHQGVFCESFDDPESALRVIEQLEPLQRRALAERGTPWVYAADEFYLNAYGTDVLGMLPDAAFYGDFSMFEDGIGIVRSMVDFFRDGVASGAAARLSSAMEESDMRVRLVCGEAMAAYMPRLLHEAALAPRMQALFVHNDFFGGNVDVTGLLCGCDVAAAISRDWEGLCEGGVDAAQHVAYFVPAVMFNDDAVTLDGWTLGDIRRHVGPEIGDRVFLAPSNPIDYMEAAAKVSKPSLNI